MPRRLDGGQHGRVGLGGAMQQGPAGNAADATLHRARVAVPIPHGRGRGLPAPVCGRAKLARPALPPIDAEQEIQGRAQDWRQPRQPDPADCGRDLPLVQQHVHGDERDQDQSGRE